jgi:hypothetical protein
MPCNFHRKEPSDTCGHLEEEIFWITLATYPRNGEGFAQAKRRESEYNENYRSSIHRVITSYTDTGEKSYAVQECWYCPYSIPDLRQNVTDIP